MCNRGSGLKIDLPIFNVLRTFHEGGLQVVRAGVWGSADLTRMGGVYGGCDWWGEWWGLAVSVDMRILPGVFLGLEAPPSSRTARPALSGLGGRFLVQGSVIPPSRI